MDWSLFDKAPSRWRSYVIKINQAITGHADRFDSEVYIREDIPAKVLTYLNTLSGRDGTLSLSSKKSYLAALSSYLDIAGIDNEPYKTLITRLASEIKDVPKGVRQANSVTREELVYALESPKVHYIIKLMVAILLYGYRKKLKLAEVIQTRLDQDNGKHNYLNMETRHWTIHKPNSLPKTIEISEDLYNVIREGAGPVWVCRANNTSSMSIMFKQMFKHSYLAVAQMLNPEETDTDSDESSIADSEPEPPSQQEHEHQPKSQAPEELKPIKPKITVKTQPTQQQQTVRASKYEWVYFRRQDADDIHIRRVKQIMDMIVGDHEYFYHERVDCEEGLRQIREKINTMESINSQLNYVNSLCKFLEHTMARSYVNYTLWRDEIGIKLHQHNAERTVEAYLDILPRLEEALSMKGNTADLKLVCKMLICIQDYTNMDTGALRFSDLVNTKLHDDGRHHYLDLKTNVWHLRKEFTKNKQDRIAKISHEFSEYVYVNCAALDECGLICGSAKGKTDRISAEFTKRIKINFSMVRASYVTYLDEVCTDVETIKHICNNQGHKLATALESYRRKPTVEEE